MSPSNLHRVLYAIALDPTQKFGSLEEQIAFLAKAFEAQKSLFSPLFICQDDAGQHSVYKEVGIETEYLDLRSFRWSRLAKLSSLIGRHQITLVHWNFTEMLRNKYVWWLSVLHPKVKHCYTDHASRGPQNQLLKEWLKNALKKILFRRYTKVFCVSQFVLNELQRQHTCSNPILCLHFVNTDRFRPDSSVRAEIRSRLHVEDRFVLLTIAHLIKEKGVDVLIRALTGLPENVVLWIVGDGEQSEELRALCSELHLTSRVHFHGLQHNVAPFMQAADCLVCPSLWQEAAGLVNLEASASGLPVIASRIGGIPEYIEDGRTGLLFSPGNQRELIRHIESLNENRALCEKMSVEARVRTVKLFSAKVRVKEYLELYRT